MALKKVECEIPEATGVPAASPFGKCLEPVPAFPWLAFCRPSRISRRRNFPRLLPCRHTR